MTDRGDPAAPTGRGRRPRGRRRSGGIPTPDRPHRRRRDQPTTTGFARSSTGRGHRPRRSRRPPRSPTPRRRLAIGALAAVVLGLAAAAAVPVGGSLLAGSGSTSGGPAPAPADPDDRTCPTPPTTDTSTTNGSAGRVLWATLDDGCPWTVTWSPRRAELAIPRDDGARYRLGAPGDVVVVGDWDGDGVDTPALYEPDTGMVHRYDHWPSTGAPARPRSRDSGVVHGTPGVVEGDDGDRVVVEP
ncbi:MAG: hypothetical protein U5R31_03915 [Acidimicrobiia bacterium]|nr:hypothetical protein [Acidimicrobiia bacterium]